VISPLLRAPLPGHQVRRDPVQPRAYRAAAGVEAVALVQRDHERVRGDVVGHVSPQPPGDVPVDLGEVPLVNVGEVIGHRHRSRVRLALRHHAKKSVMRATFQQQLTCHRYFTETPGSFHT